MQEMLLNDSAYKDGIVVSYVLMQTRAQQFDALVEMTNEAVGDIEAFAGVLSKLNGTREMVANVCQQLNAAGDDLEAVLEGEDCPDVEQNTINAALAYTTLQKQNQLADSFIETADSYIAQNGGSDQLKLVRDSWMDYQQMTVALDGDTKAADALAKKGYLLTPEQSIAVMADGGLGYSLNIMMSAVQSSNLGIKNHIAEAYTSDQLNNIMGAARLGAISLKNGSTAEELNALMVKFHENPSQLAAQLSSEKLGFIQGNSEKLGSVRGSETLANLSDADMLGYMRSCASMFFATEKTQLGRGGSLGNKSQTELGLGNKDQATLGIRGNFALNAMILCSSNQIQNTNADLLKGICATEAALNAQESLSFRRTMCLNISDVISATSQGLGLQNGFLLGNR